MISTLKNTLVLDIETVGMTPTLSSLPERLQKLWIQKTQYFNLEEKDPAVLFEQKAGIYAEFGKIVCIGLGVFDIVDKKQIRIKTKTIFGDDEKSILLEFKELLDAFYHQKTAKLCAHNGKEFDFPYLCRRMLVHGIALPKILDLTNKKPWEVPHYDTLELWKFGDRKSYTSLELLAAMFDIPTSKSDIDGSKVHETYYALKDVKRIATYCEQDIAVTAQLFLKLIAPEHVMQVKIVPVN